MKKQKFSKVELSILLSEMDRSLSSNKYVIPYFHVARLFGKERAKGTSLSVITWHGGILRKLENVPANKY